MAKFEARQVPDNTREITYTSRNGEQRSIRITHGAKGALAHPETLEDDRHLDRVIAHLPADADTKPATKADEETSTTTAPATGGQEG